MVGREERRLGSNGRVGLVRGRVWVFRELDGEEERYSSSVDCDEEENDPDLKRSSSSVDEVILVFGTLDEICERCFWRASCWEWRSRYFCNARPRSGLACEWVGEIDMVVYIDVFCVFV